MLSEATNLITFIAHSQGHEANETARTFLQVLCASEWETTYTTSSVFVDISDQYFTSYPIQAIVVLMLHAQYCWWYIPGNNIAHKTLAATSVGFDSGSENTYTCNIWSFKVANFNALIYSFNTPHWLNTWPSTEFQKHICIMRLIYIYLKYYFEMRPKLCDNHSSHHLIAILKRNWTSLMRVLMVYSSTQRGKQMILSCHYILLQ